LNVTIRFNRENYTVVKRSRKDGEKFLIIGKHEKKIVVVHGTNGDAILMSFTVNAPRMKEKIYG